MVDSGSKQTLRVDPPRAKRAEQNDKDMDWLRQFRETKKRKENIQEQYKMLSQQQLHEEVHKEDGRDNSAVDNKRAKVGSTATASAKATVKTNAQANAHKGAAANKLLPSSGNATVNEATLKSQLVANIAMRDRRANHFNFLLKELRMVWENGNMRLTLAPTMQAAESTVGGLTSDEEADNPSNAKGTKTWKGPLYKGAHVFILEANLGHQVYQLRSWFAQALLAIKLIFSINNLVLLSPRQPLLSSANCNNTPVIVNSHHAPPARPRLAHSDLVTAIDWDVDSDDKKAELKQIEQDSTPGAKPRTGYYKHPFLQTACDATVFTKQKGKPPIGTKFSKMFVKMLLPTIALLCAIIHFLLETYHSNKEEHDDTIIREMLEEYYKDHLDNLLTLAKVDPDAIDRIQTGMYQRGIKQAPIKPAMIAKSEAKANSRWLSIKDIVRFGTWALNGLQG
ncbi:hypothetical protein RHS01_05176 [Rhizoctonia solani]|uniref:DUF6532 domain-containing protein n=1 Tax=Rhizoctonia solani TaxID=456999 RepID=A0A8H7IFG0_9AGAM|nr:hypothetical protein RHS01_05176 [Rhizoctonia solani]